MSQSKREKAARPSTFTRLDICGAKWVNEEAIRLFQESLNIQPTTEAYTYLGWTYGHMGNYQRAIDEAEKAIIQAWFTIQK